MTRPRAISKPSVKIFIEFRGEEIQVLERFRDQIERHREPLKSAILRLMRKELG